jgi:hypothetical protein
MLTLSWFIATRATPCRTGRKSSLKVAGFDPFLTGWFYSTAEKEWGKLIGDIPAVTAVLDRFLHHATVIKIK